MICSNLEPNRITTEDVNNCSTLKLREGGNALALNRYNTKPRIMKLLKVFFNGYYHSRSVGVIWLHQKTENHCQEIGDKFFFKLKS